MPIPEFDANSVLPPHLGDPRDASQLSPYPCTTVELCQRFGTTPQRRAILRGLLAFRQRIGQLDVVDGFQWLDGSFLEDVEMLENRPPNDMDVVTFYRKSGPEFEQNVMDHFPEFRDRHLSKANYRLDHFPVDVTADPFLTVEFARYWIGLFSHRRSRVWKGMLSIGLNTMDEDNRALAILESQS